MGGVGGEVRVRAQVGQQAVDVLPAGQEHQNGAVVHIHVVAARCLGAALVRGWLGLVVGGEGGADVVDGSDDQAVVDVVHALLLQPLHGGDRAVAVLQHHVLHAALVLTALGQRRGGLGWSGGWRRRAGCVDGL